MSNTRAGSAQRGRKSLDREATGSVRVGKSFIGVRSTLMLGAHGNRQHRNKPVDTSLFAAFICGKAEAVPQSGATGSGRRTA